MKPWVEEGNRRWGSFFTVFLSFLFLSLLNRTTQEEKTLLSPLISLSFCKTEVLNEGKLIMGAGGWDLVSCVSLCFIKVLFERVYGNWQ
jgi:hypothetical protein